MSPTRFFCTIFKVARVVCSLAIAAAGYFLTVKLPGRSRCIATRAAWLQREARRLLRAIGVETGCVGAPPAGGVLVSNHISYLDILVHAAQAPQVFISKAEVAGWPVFGPLTKCAGTLFIRRELRSDVLRVAAEMLPVVHAGTVLTFFPEGTSTGGDRVLPFRAPLLAPLVEHGWPVTPAFLRYELPPQEGTVEEAVAYYRPETVFGPHLLQLLGRRGVRATVTYGMPQEPGSDRKELAARLREAICTLGDLPVVI